MRASSSANSLSRMALISAAAFSSCDLASFAAFSAAVFQIGRAHV
jgi:hypothetical protein